MLKRLLNVLSVVVITLTLLINTSYVHAQENKIKVILDGTEVTFDVNPEVIEGRVMVPVRKFLESLKMKVTYDDANKTVLAYGQNIAMVLKIGSKAAVVGEKKVELAVPAAVIKNRTMVPLRFIAENTGANVTWDEAARTVVINTKVNSKGDAVDKINLSSLEYQK